MIMIQTNLLKLSGEDDDDEEEEEYWRLLFGPFKSGTLRKVQNAPL
jgi:hypothetical protein